MTSNNELGLVAAWFLFGQARIVLTYKLAEHRIDEPAASGWALAVGRAGGAARRTAANYDDAGRRVLPWYRGVNRAYWTLVAVACAWALLDR